MSDNLPSATPEKCGDETAATKHPDKEGQDEPKKDSKFTAKQIFEFGGLAGALVVLAEMIGCHDFAPLVIYAVAVNVLILLPLHFVYELLKKRKVWIPILIWIALFMTTVLIVLKNSRPVELEPSAHFTFSLLPTDNPEDEVKLTNSFLIFVEIKPQPILGILLVPAKDGQSNAVFRFVIRSAEFVNSPRVVVNVRKDWKVKFSPPWQPLVLQNPKNLIQLNSSDKIVGTDESQQWYLDVPQADSPSPTIAVKLPALEIPNPLSLTEKGSFAIEVDSEKWPSEILLVDVKFLKIPDDVPDMKPFVSKYEKDWSFNISRDQYVPLKK